MDGPNDNAHCHLGYVNYYFGLFLFSSNIAENDFHIYTQSSSAVWEVEEVTLNSFRKNDFPRTWVIFQTQITF